MYKDKHGFYYFVDRIGDSFRWKGENVATSEVESVILMHQDVQEVTVYGVQIAGIQTNQITFLIWFLFLR